MKSKTESEKLPTFTEKKYEKMYQEAIARPGIREAVSVYNSWNKSLPKKPSFPATSDDT